MATIETQIGQKQVDGIAPLSQRAERRYNRVKREFARLAEKPMGGDKKMGAFYIAVSELTKTNEQFQDLIKSAAKRKTTPDHLANLLLRGVQYIEIFENHRTSYEEAFVEPDAWEELLIGENGVITNHKTKLEAILRTKETTTTKYPRYAGVKAALNAVFIDQDIKVADFGCGANYGLQGLRGDIPFPPITVDTTAQQTIDGRNLDGEIKQMIESPVHLEEGLAVDKNDPSGDEERNWRFACSFYPGELSKESLRELFLLEEAMEDIDRTDMNFLQGDILKLQVNHADGTLPVEHFDAIVMSTILYQMSQEQQAHMIETARKSLRDGGVIILQDFATKDDNNMTGLSIKGLSPEPYAYRTFLMGKADEEWKEFLQWETGRCKKVRPGKDFDAVKPFSPGPTNPVDIFNAA